MIKFAKLFPKARIPTIARDGDAGFDLYALEGGMIRDGAITTAFTGIAVEIPYDYVGLVCPRSGLSFGFGIQVINSPGIIDSNFRGEIQVGLIKKTLGAYHFAPGDRIAQLVVVQRCLLASIEVDPSELSTTNRGSNGFGSSGK